MKKKFYFILAGRILHECYAATIADAEIYFDVQCGEHVSLNTWIEEAQ